MSTESRYRILGGIFLVLLGGALLAVRIIPGIEDWSGYFQGWPMTVVAVGVMLFVLGLLTNSPGMAVPASIVTGIGGILLYQNNSGNWESWSYIWALIPGFVGVGVIVSGLLEGKFRKEVSNGLWLLFISAVLLISFGAFLGNVAEFKNFWPVALILFGLWVLIRPVFRSR